MRCQGCKREADKLWATVSITIDAADVGHVLNLSADVCSAECAAVALRDVAGTLEEVSASHRN